MVLRSSLTMFVPSRYQTDIFKFLEQGQGDLLVDAVPGSGKTTTCVEAANRINESSSIFLAFNKHIAQELGSRLTNMKTKTIHALGLGSLGFRDAKIEAYKYHGLVREFLKDKALSSEESALTQTRIISLLSLTQLTLTDSTNPKALQTVANHYGLDQTDWQFVSAAVAPILEKGKQIAPQVIDFNDMVWLPYVLERYPDPNRWVFVDEAQDLNPAQLDLVMKARRQGGRIIFVGDKRQAIYGFTGADTQSIQTIIDRTKASTLPLSICYRCPKSHIALANEVYETIEPRPNAPDGVVQTIAMEDVIGLVRKEDLILCRTNAPLVSLCFELIKARIPAKVRGKDIGTQLASILKQLQKAGSFPIQQLPERLSDYYQHQVKLRAGQDNADMALVSIHDRVETIKAIYASRKPNHIQELY